MKQRLLLILAAFGVLAGVTADDGFTIRFDESTTDGNRRTLTGNVVIEVGNIRFEADEVVQHFENGLPVKFDAVGTPVVITQNGEALQGLEKGTAETLTYRVAEKTLLLTNYELTFSGSIVQRGKQLTLTFE